MAPDPVQAASPGAFPRLCRGVQRVAAGRVALRPRTDPGGQRAGRPHGLLPMRLRGGHVPAQPPGTRQAGHRRRRAAHDVLPGRGRAGTGDTRPRPVAVRALDQKRRTVLLAQLAQGTFPVPAERVVIGPSIAYGMTGFEAVNVIYPAPVVEPRLGRIGRSRRRRRRRVRRQRPLGIGRCRRPGPVTIVRCQLSVVSR